MLMLSGLHDTSDSGVAALQQALARLAVASGRPEINPGPATGVMNVQTMVAVASSFDIVGAELPWYGRYSLQGVLLLGASTDMARTQVTNYAQQLAIAADAAALKVRPKTSGLPFNIPVDWYTTPEGLAFIVLAGFVGYRMFFKKPTKAVTR